MSEPHRGGEPVSIAVRTQIAAAALVPVLALAPLLLWYFPSQLEASARRGAQTRLQSLGDLVSRSVASELDGTRAANAPELGAELTRRLEALGADPDFLRAAVFDRDGKLLAGVGEGHEALEVATAEGVRAWGADELHYAGEVTGAEAPAPEEPVIVLGSVRIDLGLGSVRQLQAAQRRAGVIMGGVVLLLCGGLGFLIGGRIAARVVAATRVVSAVARGDLSVRPAAVRGGDELDAMFTALASMIDELRALDRQARALANRQLHVRVHGQGDLDRSFREMVVQQREIVREMGATVAEVEASTAEILATVREQEHGAQDQASAVEITRKTTVALLEAAEEIAQIASRVHDNAGRTRESNQAIAERAHELAQLSRQISGTLLTLREIADRANVLALNAALEGTKAGDAGRGFTLVAEEMQRLAERVKEATTEIDGQVEQIREASQASVLATEQGVKMSAETSRSADRIHRTSQEQQLATQQVTQSMREIGELLQQAVSGANQTTQATEELNSRAARLRDLVATYNLEDEVRGTA